MKKIKEHLQYLQLFIIANPETFRSYIIEQKMERYLESRQKYGIKKFKLSKILKIQKT